MDQYIRNFPITSSIIAINIFIFILAQFLPTPIYFLSTPGVISTGTFLSHFSHFDMLHIAFNMIVFARIAPMLENQLSKIEYTACIIAIWQLTVWIAQPFVTSFSLGFSGILMGILTMTAVLYWHYTTIRQQLLFMAAINIAIGLLPGISFLMHATGALSGLIVGLLLTRIHTQHAHHDQ